MVFARNKTSMDTTLCAKIVYDKEQVKEVYWEKTEEELKEAFWQKVKEVNQTLPDVKHIKEIMITEEPLAKTTTQKVKRYEEIKKSWLKITKMGKIVLIRKELILFFVENGTVLFSKFWGILHGRFYQKTKKTKN